MYRKTLLFAGALLAFVLLPGQQEDCQVPFQIVLSPEVIHVGAEAGQVFIEVIPLPRRIADAIPWTAQSFRDWCSVSPESGTGPGRLTVTYQANPGTTPRVAIIKGKTEDDSAETRIEQAGKSEPSLQGFLHVFSQDTVLNNVPEVLTADNAAAFFGGGMEAIFPGGILIPPFNVPQVRPQQEGVPPAPSPVPDLSGATGPLSAGVPGQVFNGAATLQFVAGSTPGLFPQSPEVFTDFNYGDILNIAFPGGPDIGAFSFEVTLPVQPIVTLPVISNSGLGGSFDLNLDQALTVNWDTDGVELGDFITITLIVQEFPAAGNALYGDIYVATEDDGSYEIPAADLAQMPRPASGDFQFASLTVGRFRVFQEEVPLTAGGTGIVGSMTGASLPATSQRDVP